MYIQMFEDDAYLYEEKADWESKKKIKSKNYRNLLTESIRLKLLKKRKKLNKHKNY